MPFNTEGVFSVIYTWATEALSPPIALEKMDEQELDIAAGLSLCLTRDGRSLPSDNLDFNNKRLKNIANAAADTDAISRIYADGRYPKLVNANTFLDVNTFNQGVTIGGVVTLSSTATNAMQIAGRVNGQQVWLRGTYPQLIVSAPPGGTAVFDMVQESLALDNKKWRFQLDQTTGTYSIGALNDAESVQEIGFSLGRSGANVISCGIAADLINLTGTVNVNGTSVNNASGLTSGTIPDARIAQTGVTQHMGAGYARNISTPAKGGNTKTLSSSGPSGGNDGDIWYRY